MVSLVRSLVSNVRKFPQQLNPGHGGFDIGMLLSGYADSGSYVDRDSALRVSAVYACVNLISRTIGSLPLHVYERDGDGRKQVRTKDTQYLWGRPNREVSRSIMWETVIGHAVLSGNGFLYVVTDGMAPVELYPVDPQRVKVGRDSTGKKVYTIDGTVVQRDFVDGGNIVHISGWGTDGLVGLSPIALERNGIGLALAAEKSASKLISNGGQPSGVITGDQKINQAQADEFATLWEEKHAGAENAGRVVVLGSGMTWTPTVINPDDMQALETRRYQVVDIARMWLVPPEMIGASSEGSNALTYASLQDRMQHFVTFTLQPWITRFEQTVSDELLAPQDQYVKFDVRGLLRGNSAERIAFYQGLAALEAITVGEIRELEDMEPMKLGAGA